MSKIIDITNKLRFEEKPGIRIKDTVISVNNDAPTMMEVMAILEDSKNNMTSGDIKRLAVLLFGEEEKEKLDSLKLDIDDYTQAIINTAMVAVNRFEESKGEEETPAMT